MGFDSFGSSHIIRRIPPGIIGEAKSPLQSIRLFNGKDYGYYRADMSNLDSILGGRKNQPVSLDMLKESKKDKKRLGMLQRLFNTERHCIEANQLKLRLKERTLHQHVRTKKQISEELQVLMKLKSDSHQ